jgi:hypothetical protein
MKERAVFFQLPLTISVDLLSWGEALPGTSWPPTEIGA